MLEAADTDAVAERAVAAAGEGAPLRGANHAQIRVGLDGWTLPRLDEPNDRL